MSQVVASEGDGWILPRLRPTPVRHFTEPLALQHADCGAPARRTYIRCLANNPAPHFDRCAMTAQSSTDWTYRELMLPDLPFITHPDETTAVLLEVAA
jgi:hypothetical protein